MALSHSPKIITNGLVFAMDMGNLYKSFKGAPATNLIPTPTTNGYPSAGNSWGTYNTNQYNSGSYFSIGTISSVTSNIVTTSTAHPLRSYDVVMPQTTGGGVTAGTSYLVKKLSSTTFSLHAYNSSQDGSQGYINSATGNFKVYDDYANDVRVSINSTSFPTMWWGYPHLPNSALVKEIIPNGFTNPQNGFTSDCIRLHWHRDDGVKDGMAYGADSTLTAGQTYTTSFWVRPVTDSAVGQSMNFQHYIYGVTSADNPYWNFTLGAKGVWERKSFTFTTNNNTCISYWFNYGSAASKVDISNIQTELGSSTSQFIGGTRSNTAAILDQTGLNTVTANSLTYANNEFSFNGSSNYLTIPFNSTYFKFDSNQTIIMWIKDSSSSSTRRNPYNQAYGGGGTITHENDGAFNYYFGTAGNNNSPYQGFTSSMSVTIGETAMIALTRNPTTLTWYKNGVFSNSTTNGYPTATTGTSDILIGTGYTSPFQGNIYVVQLYNTCLTAAEIMQNFNALRGRFGL